MHVDGVVLKGFWDGVAIDVEDVKAQKHGSFCARSSRNPEKMVARVGIGAGGREEDRFEFLWREGICLGRGRSWNSTVECRQVFCVLHDGSVTCVPRHPCVVASDTRRSTWNHSEPQHRGRQLQHQGSVSAPVEPPARSR